MAEERQETGKKKGNEKGEVSRNLPRNYRQIGEPGAKKIYVEDYVYTYLNKLAQPENLYARGAILFGKMYKTTIGKCMFSGMPEFRTGFRRDDFFRGKLGRDL